VKIELFSCSGGMAEGFRRAGITFDVVIDKDANAVTSYARNHRHRPVQMDAEDLLRLVHLGFAPPAVDLLVADPPCTPWSRAGSRKGLDDDRDQLVTTVELIRALRPLCWLIANVPGLDDGPNLKHVHATIGSIAGYHVDFRRLDAADYGVPQRRVRPFWFGRPASSEPLRWPAPTHSDPSELGMIAETRAPWITCRDALGHLSAEDRGKPIRIRWRDDTDHRPSSIDEPAKTLTRNTHSDGALLVHERHPVSAANEPSRAVTGSDGGGAKGARVIEWPWDRPSTTVFEDPRLLPPGSHPKTGSIMSQPNAVAITERAAAILQGFPEGWHFAGATKRSRWSQIGQAMPPGLAQPVAEAIATWMAQHAIVRSA
jgi:DNA (cytosine-5)-methyltransferase 1